MAFRVISAVAAAIGLCGCSIANVNFGEQNSVYHGQILVVHLHALGVNDQGPAPVAACVGMTDYMTYDPQVPWGQAFLGKFKTPECDNPIWSPTTDAELRAKTLQELERLNIRGVLSGPRARVAEWKEASPDHIISGHALNIAIDNYSPEDIASYFQSGGFEVLSEVTNQYNGIAPDDPRFAEYWQVAADLDIPVGIHIGTGPPGAAYLFSGYRAHLHSPLALEEVLIKHPTLRVYVMHAAWPMRDEMKAMLYTHPQLYVGTGVLQMALPRDEYYDFLQDLVRSGFGNRIMFGSDQMVWPELIEEGINAINEAPFLSKEQKTAILYENAARFLRIETLN
jgi:predicted TIM-barrel fold metal-dependent hydrolase